MRWLVEVTSTGNSEKQTFCVEADSWQKALQVARSSRNESTGMSGFSIELLDDGCRAVDPASRIRYEIRRTADTTPLSLPGSTPPPRPGPAKADGAPRSSAPPGPTAFEAKQTLVFGANAQGPKVVRSDSSSPRPDAMAKTLNGPTGGGNATLIPSHVELIFRREHDATPTTPLTYREYVFRVPGGTSETSAEQLLRLRLDDTRTQLATAPAGKFVQLAVFDLVFEGKPPVPPLVTLSWKDWKKEPVIAYPRRGVPKAPPAAAGRTISADATEVDLPPVMQAPPPPSGAAPPAAGLPSSDPVMVPPPPAFTPAQPIPVAVTQLGPGGPAAPHFPTLQSNAPPNAHPSVNPAVRPSANPVAHPSVGPAANPHPSANPAANPHPSVNPTAATMAGPAPQAIAGAAPPGASWSSTFARTVVQPPAVAFVPRSPKDVHPGVRTLVDDAPKVTDRPSSVPARTRARGDELIADLFEAMHDLHFVRDAVEGGAFCLALAIEKLPSAFGLVHLYDIDHREFIVTSTRGAGAQTLLLRRQPETDIALSAAMRKRRAVVVDPAEPHVATLERYVILGGIRSVLVAPVMQAGRFLGAIELMNPLDENPFTDDEGNALTYIGEQFAEFVALRGVVTDPERINAAAQGRA